MGKRASEAAPVVDLSNERGRRRATTGAVDPVTSTAAASRGPALVDLAAEQIRRRPDSVVVDPVAGFRYDAAKLAKSLRWAAARGRQI